MKRFILSCAIIFIFAGFIFANSISVLISQKTSQAEDVFESSRLFEDGIINYLFDNGFIVSNEPVCLEEDFLESFQIALDEAQKGYFKYLIAFHVNLNSENGNIKDAEWSLFEVKTAKQIAKGKSLAPEVKSKTETEKIIKQFAEQNCREFIKYIRK